MLLFPLDETPSMSILKCLKDIWESLFKTEFVTLLISLQLRTQTHLGKVATQSRKRIGARIPDFWLPHHYHYFHTNIVTVL